jgi:P27 family predicted phage terminase small subunit
MTSKRIHAPSHLRPETRAWYRSVVAEYELQSHHLRILQLCAEAWDRSREARALLEKDGLVCTNKYGETRPHPGIQIEKDSRSAFLRGVRELALDLAEDAPRPAAVQPQKRRAIA